MQRTSRLGFSVYEKSDGKIKKFTVDKKFCGTGIKNMNENNIRILRKGDEEFPKILAEMNEPVERLYCTGDISLLGEFKAAVVGARKCSEYGRQAAFRTGKAFAELGIVTVSGMAAGIDGTAHRGALSGGGGTIAVLGCGPDVCYPEANYELYNQILKNGLIVSEYPPGTKPKPWQFPRRNRIIAALSSSVVVAEAGENSGAAITAVRAAEMGIDVFALPGNITSPCSAGTNRLIRDGARIITSLEYMIEEIKNKRDEAEGFCEELRQREDEGLSERKEHRRHWKNACRSAETQIPALGGDEKKVYEAISLKDGATVDFICGKLGKSPLFINGIVSVLEMKGIVYYELGKIFIAKF